MIHDGVEKSHRENSMLTTIRGRIVVVFVACLAFAAILTSFYYWNVFSIEKRMAIAESFEDLFNEILEIRRYEKNFLFYHDRDSLNETISYIRETLEITDRLGKDIVNVTDEAQFKKFRSDLTSYKDMMEEQLVQMRNSAVDIGCVLNQRQGAENVEMIRSKGKNLVDFAQQLLNAKRERIHRALARTLSIPIVFVAGLILLLSLIFRLVVKDILSPLALIQDTTGNVARGDFTPITYTTKREDEISSLIAAFNKMAIELESRQEELVQSRKIAAIGTFTSGIAHELNNPINNINLTAETLLEDAASLSEAESKELLLDILNQAERASDIVRNLLDFSHSETSSFADLTVGEVVDSTLRLVKNQMMVSHIKLEKTIPENLPKINGNLRNLQQVFLNLFLNAIQSMPGGGVVTVNASNDVAHYVRVDVIDTGVGIRSEVLAHIFDPFFSTKEVGRGTGLGLSVTYNIVKKHGGYIEVQSEVNVGTTFSVFLPVQDKQDVSVA